MILENENTEDNIENFMNNKIITIQIFQNHVQHHESDDLVNIKRSKRISSLYESTKYYLYDSNQNLQSNYIIMNRIYNNSKEACKTYNEDDYHKITNIMLAILDIYNKHNHASIDIQNLYNNCALWVQNYNLVHNKSVEMLCDTREFIDATQNTLRVIAFPKTFCTDIEPVMLPVKWVTKLKSK